MKTSRYEIDCAFGVDGRSFCLDATGRKLSVYDYVFCPGSAQPHAITDVVYMDGDYHLLIEDALIRSTLCCKTSKPKQKTAARLAA